MNVAPRPIPILLSAHCRRHSAEGNTPSPRSAGYVPSPVRLENARLEAHDRGIEGDWGAFMLRRLILIAGIVAIGLALDGCTKCGPIWDDWVQSPKSCKSDRL
jgi:hypothetical protein